MPRRVVKPQDWDDRINGPWRPQTSFAGESSSSWNRDPSAAQRFIRHNMDHNQYGGRGGGGGGGGNYYQDRGRGYNNRGSYSNPNSYDPARSGFSTGPRQMPFLTPPPPPRFPIPPGAHHQAPPPQHQQQRNYRHSYYD